MPKSSRTIICCHGGHGRTGTALASMIIADPKWEKSSEKILLGSGHSSKYKVTDVIDYIRDRHCNKAIETTGQEDYLEKLLSQRFSK